jgi:hypothetical protein
MTSTCSHSLIETVIDDSVHPIVTAILLFAIGSILLSFPFAWIFRRSRREYFSYACLALSRPSIHSSGDSSVPRGTPATGRRVLGLGMLPNGRCFFRAPLQQAAFAFVAGQSRGRFECGTRLFVTAEPME